MKKILVFLLFILFNCHKIDHGYVIDKYVIPAHTAIRNQPIRIGKTMILLPHTYYYPENYAVNIELFINKEKITDMYYISKKQYECIVIGDMFKVNENCSKDLIGGLEHQ